MDNLLLYLKVAPKYLLSFLKSDWKLTDYPIRFRYSVHANDNGLGRLKPIPWTAQIINWWQLQGFGDTKEQAYSDLETKFNERRLSASALPRPGTDFPIEFATTDRVDSFDDIAADFFRRIFDMNYADCFISDESTLWDFHTDESNEHLHHKIWDAYSVDVSDIEDANLVKIFERIENRPGRT